jgi:hypothetical protein
MTLPKGADYSLTESALIPFQSEPTQFQLIWSTEAVVEDDTLRILFPEERWTF